MVLRQLAVLGRQAGRPELKPTDRVFLWGVKTQVASRGTRICRQSADLNPTGLRAPCRLRLFRNSQSRPSPAREEARGRPRRLEGPRSPSAGGDVVRD